MESVLQAFHTPLHDPVVVIALAMVAFVAAPLLFQRLRLPTTVAFIAVGAVLGPNGLGWMARDDTIILLGTVGLLYLMFMAAVEIDLHDFDRHRSNSVFFGLLGFLAPQLLGFGIGRLLGYSIATSALLGSMLSSHTLLAYPAASRLGIGKNRAVTVAVGATIITDLLALLVLAALAASREGNLSFTFWVRLAGGLALFAVAVLKGLPIAADWFFRRVAEDDLREYVFVLAALFVSAVLAELAGVEPIIGAFLAGLALNPMLPEGQPLTSRLNFFSDAFFTPFFLFSVGMLVDVRVLASGPRVLAVTGGMLASVLPAKWLAAALTRRRFGYSSAEAWTMFGLSVPQAAATLAIGLIGYRLKLFDVAILNATIMVILVTSTLGPWLVERSGRRVAIEEQRRPFRPGTEPQRILLPVLSPEDAEALVDSALLVRSPRAREPLLPLAVVRSGLRGVAARVAQAEKLLGHAVMRATGAGVTALPLTRVAPDLATGIVRGIAESRATTVLAAWSGRRDKRRSILNRGLDQMIAASAQLVMVLSTKASLKTLKRMVVLLPPAVDRGPGFCDAIHVVKLMASRLTADLSFHAVRSDPQAIRTAVNRMQPPVPYDLHEAPNWFALMRALEGHTGPDTLLVLLSERRGHVAWHRELDRMPRRLAGMAVNLAVMYPCTMEPSEAHDDHVTTLLAEALHAGRVVTNLGALAPETAIQSLVRTEFESDSPRFAEAVSAIETCLVEHSAEIAPGAYFFFGRMAQLAAPLLFVGTSPVGLAVPPASNPVHVAIAIVAPTDHRTSAATYLDQLRPVLSSRGRISGLARCSSADCVATFFRADDQRLPMLVPAA